MQLLTDHPEACRVLIGHATAAEPLAAADVGASMRDLWATFGSAGGAWAARLAPATPPASERLLVVREHAPRSQFDLMNEVLGAGGDLPDGLACVALTGSGFRGQRGRAWAALRGNLHVSVHLTLDVEAASHQVGLTVLPAVATARAIERLSQGRVAPRLKWVNDVLLGGRKVAGVLTATQVVGERVQHAVLGIGVNVTRAPELTVSPWGAAATALAAFEPSLQGPAGEDGWARLLVDLLDEIEGGRASLLADGGATLLDAYRARAAFLGRHATIWPVDENAAADVAPLARGRVLELRDDLSLVIEGRTEPVHVGRMTLD